jgi:drug/metabolite transporter (DMT)-like permease
VSAKSKSPALASYQLGLLLVSASTLAWSTAGLFTRAVTLDAWTMLVWRGFFGGLGLVALMLLMGGAGALRDFGRLGWPGSALAAVGAAGMICFVAALRFTTVAHAAIIYATFPFLAALLAWLVARELPSRSALAASLVALAGVAIMMGAGREGGLLGDILALGMTLSMAVSIMIVRQFRNSPAMAASAAMGFISASVALPWSQAFSVSGHDLIVLALFGIVNSSLGLALFTLGSRLLPPMETALIGALDAPLAPVWVWLVFSETPGEATLIGGSVVLAAVTLHMVRETWRQSRNNP